MLVYKYFFKCDRVFLTFLSFLFFACLSVCETQRRRRGGNPPFSVLSLQSSESRNELPLLLSFLAVSPSPLRPFLPLPLPANYPPFRKKTSIYIGKQFAIKTGRKRRRRKGDRDIKIPGTKRREGCLYCETQPLMGNRGEESGCHAKK